MAENNYRARRKSGRLAAAAALTGLIMRCKKGHLVVTHFNGATRLTLKSPFSQHPQVLTFNFPTCLPQCVSPLPRPFTPLTPHPPPPSPSAPDSRHCSTPLVSVILFIFAKAPFLLQILKPTKESFYFFFQETRQRPRSVSTAGFSPTS